MFVDNIELKLCNFYRESMVNSITRIVGIEIVSIEILAFVHGMNHNP